MAYTINLTDGTLFATIPDGTTNTSSSMTLVGQNYEDYGTFIDTNFIRLLENGSNTTAPGAPLTGQLWWDKTNNLLKVYNGTTFKSISGATASATAPTSNVAGDLWYDTSVAQLKVYTGSAWLLVGPGYTSSTGVTGAIVDTVTDNLSNSHVIIKMYVSDTIVGIVSKDATFTPSGSGISGFATIAPGFNLSTAVSNAVFTGTATTANNSTYLNSLASSQFMRSDANTSTTGSLTVQSLSIATTSGTTNLTSTGNVSINGGNISLVSSGKVSAPTPTASSNDNSIATTEFVKSQIVTEIPSGMIVLWSGSVASVPTGWYLCNGSNGTPDLRGKFIIGAGGSYSPGATGGNATVTLSVSNLPAHNHDFSVSGPTVVSGSIAMSGTTDSAGSHTHTTSTVITDSGHLHVYPGDDQLYTATGYAGWTGTSVTSFPYDARSVTGGGGQMWQTTSSTTGISANTTINLNGAHTHGVSVSGTANLSGRHRWRRCCKYFTPILCTLLYYERININMSRIFNVGFKLTITE
jgi:microcystin-dependent protein